MFRCRHAGRIDGAVSPVGIVHLNKDQDMNQSAMKKFYKGMNVVITGASSGIGRDLALLFAEYGASLALSARRTELLEAVRDECSSFGAETYIFPADVTSREEMEAMRDELDEHWDRVDLVVANAGVGGLNPARKFDLEIHRSTVEINLVGTANTLAPFVPRMIERRKGCLVGISSLAAFRGLPGAASYCSSKAAQKAFLESFRVDLRRYGIRVLSIHPGFIETPMTDHGNFQMPFMMPVRKSSLLIARAIMKGKPVYLYPWQMRLITSVNKRLPIFIYDRLVPRLSGQRKDISAKVL